jgi:N-acetylglucosamine kinase-like BadF-type ATPase
MIKKLIVDSGSTKCEWVLLNNGIIKGHYFSKGFNPNYVNDKEISSLFGQLLPVQIKSQKIDEIFFYGTGCSTVKNCELVKELFLTFFPAAGVFVNHDLTGSAVSLFKNSEGIACILGTGSNSCHWDGKNIVKSIPSLGFLIGDEGSGTHLGKLILKYILSGKSSEILKQKLFDYTKLDSGAIIRKIYSEKNSNAWIASLSKFASQNIDDEEVVNIVENNFNDFIGENILRYENCKELPVAFTGSVAYYFKDILERVMSREGLTISRITKSPMEGLIEYHKTE